MTPVCKKILAVAAFFACLAPANQALGDSAGEVSARQSDAVPVLKGAVDDIVFSIEVTATCRSPDRALALIVSVADTVVEASPAQSLPAQIAISIPAAQLSGMQQRLLCGRISDAGGNDARSLVRGAFSAQVVGICSGGDQPERHSTVNAPLDVFIDCAVSQGAAADREN